MKGTPRTQGSEFSSETPGSENMSDVSGKLWQKAELHTWLSHRPEPVKSCGMIPPTSSLAMVFLGLGIISMILLTVVGGYFAIGKMQELAEQGGSTGYTGYDDTYSSYPDETAAENPATAPYEAPPVVEEAPAPIPDNHVTGTLTEDSLKLSSGEFAYQLDLTVQAGLKITVNLTSPDFGTYLIVMGPNGENMQNNDYEGDLNHSQVTFTAEKEGIYNIFATTSTIGETGGFKLEWIVVE